MANEKNIRIGDVLLQAGYINQDELDEALEYQKNNKGIRLGEALIKLGFITEHQQLEALSARLGQRYVKIDRIMVQTEAVAMIPVQLAKKYHMLAVQYQDNNLTIVLNDPLDYYGIEDIRQTTGMNLEIWLTELLPLNQAIEYYYSEIEAKKAASSANEMAREREQALEVDADEGDSDAPVIKLLDNLLARAFSMNASDIHIEPFEEKTSVRIRVDGQLLDYVVLQKSLHKNLIARVKILGQMDIAEKRLPQDGHFRTRIANRDVNIRTSVIPSLVRVVCPECGYWDEPTEQEKAFIGPKITRVRRAQGCNSCSHTGYVGRRAIHEILCVDNQMRRMITQRTPMEELRSYATHYLGMESLTDEALKLVADGTTTVEELKKVAYYI